MGWIPSLKSSAIWGDVLLRLWLACYTPAMRAHLRFFLSFIVISALSSCGVVGPPRAYVEVYPEREPSAEAAPIPAPAEDKPEKEPTE